MSQWSDPERWARMRRGSDCPICRAGAPRDIVAELEVSWVTAGADDPIRGYTCLVFRRHAVELHDLTELEGAAFMRAIRKLSSVLAVTTDAVKLNYEVHGNSIPHLHMHFFPRYAGDAFEGGPIDVRAVIRPVYPTGELEAFRERLAAELGGRRV